MNKIFKFFPVAFAAFALASCSSDDLMSFGQDTDAIPEVGANEAYATLDLGGTTTRSGVNIGTGENAGKYQLTWSKGDKFNLYSTNSLQFNTYTFKNWVNGNAAKGTFEIKEGDAANLSSQFTDESVANSLYAVMDDSGKGLTHSFFANKDGEACVSVDIPKRFSQLAGAVASEDNATALCMPAFAKGVTVNSEGGVSANFKAMAGLLAIDAGRLSTGTVGVVVVAKGITGTFEANLDGENPPSVASNSRYTYGNYIQVDFDAALTAAGSRFIYVPIPEGNYPSLNVYEITARPAINDAKFQQDAITADGLDADGNVNSAPTPNTAASWSINTTAIITMNDFDVVRGMNDISQAVEFTPTSTEVGSWAALSKYLYQNMDNSHAIKVTITDPSGWADNTLYIPVNSGKTKSSIEIVVPDVAKLTNVTGNVLNIVEASYNPATEGAENAATNASTSGTFVKEVKLTLQSDISSAVNAYLPTSSFVMEVPTGKALNGAVTAITADKGLFVNGAGTYASVTTVEEKNTGAITVGTGATVTELTLTKGDGAVTIGGTAKLVADNISHASDITIKGTLSDNSSYGKATPTNSNRNSGNIIFADGATNVKLTNYGSGTITAGKLATGYGTIEQYGNGAVTIGKAGSAAEDVSAANVTAITMEGTGALTVQNISGAITAINLNATSTSAVTLNNLGNIKGGTDEGIIIATGKSAVINATDAVIGKLENKSTATSTLNTYGSTALGTLTDTNKKVSINAYWTGKKSADAPSTTIFTAGQLANLPTTGTLSISDQVAVMNLGGITYPWVGAEIALTGDLTIDAKNVKIQSMNLSADDVTGKAKIGGTYASAVGLIRFVSGSKNLTIKNLDLSDIYLASTNASYSSNVGALIGKYTSTGTLTIGAADAPVKVTGIEDLNVAGNNVGGLIGYYEGGDLSITNTTVGATAITAKGYNVGGLVGNLYSGALTVNTTNVTVGTITGAYALGGLVGASSTGTATVTVGSTTKNSVSAGFAISQNDAYFTGKEEFCGSVNNGVGYVNAAVTIPVAAKATDNGLYCKNTISDTQKVALKFKLNTRTMASGKKYYFYGGNTIVGYVKSGSINSGAMVNGEDYNVYKEY